MDPAFIFLIILLIRQIGQSGQGGPGGPGGLRCFQTKPRVNFTKVSVTKGGREIVRYFASKGEKKL